jgi:hypothetical protein
MYCSSCAKEIVAGLAYCNHCGHRLSGGKADNPTSEVRPELLVSAMVGTLSFLAFLLLPFWSE